MANVRKTVFLSLLSCKEKSKYSNLEAESVLSREDMTEKEKSFFTALFYGTLERQITLDYQIYKLTGSPCEKLQVKVLVLLRMGIYQLLYMNSVPDHAAVNETVKLASETVNKGAVGLINGVLRKAATTLKDKDGSIKLITPARDRDICGYLSITHSYPRFLCKMWVSAYGEENAEKIMIAQNFHKGTTLRVNILKASRDEFLEILKKAGFKTSASALTPDGIILDGGNITELPHFNDGYCFVQDDASRKCVMALDAQEGETVYDMCACPGGKSFSAAIDMKNKGRIVSFDIHKSKLSLITEGAKRLSLDIIEAREGDSSEFNPELSESADRVLCDVPCSGFGTISKKPDLRFKDKLSVEGLPEIQLKILNNCSKYVKKGGTLVYSTCTLNPAENENNVSAFLSSNKEFTLVTMNTNFPFESNSDGFFYAVMKRC